MCDIGKCKQPSVIQYAAFGANRNKVVEICNNHWERHCDQVDKFDIRTYFYPRNEKK